MDFEALIKKLFLAHEVLNDVVLSMREGAKLRDAQSQIEQVQKELISFQSLVKQQVSNAGCENSDRTGKSEL